MDGEPPKVASLGARRFNSADPMETRIAPRDAIEGALEECDRLKPDHVLIIFGSIDPSDNTSASSYYQAGNYTFPGQLGLCFAAGLMIRDDAIGRT